MPISIPFATSQTEKSVSVIFNASSLRTKAESIDIVIAPTYVKVSHQQHIQYVVLFRDIDIENANCSGPDSKGILSFQLQKKEGGMWDKIYIEQLGENKKLALTRIEEGDKLLEDYLKAKTAGVQDTIQHNSRMAEGSAGRLDEESKKKRANLKDTKNKEAIRKLVDNSKVDTGLTHETISESVLQGIKSRVVKASLNGNIYQLPARQSRPIESIPKEIPMKQAGLNPESALGKMNPMELAEKSKGFFEKGQYEDCLSVLNTLLEHVPTFVPAHSSKCSCLIHLGHYGEALSSSRDAIRLSMDEEATKGFNVRKCDLALMYTQRAVCHLLVGDNQGALESITTAHNLNPEDENITLDMSRISKVVDTLK